MTAGPYQMVPDLSAEELLALRDSVEEHGVMVPIVVDDHGRIIDGHHRQLLADTFGIECPRVVRSDLTETDKRTLSYELNANRRNWNVESRRLEVRNSLTRDPHLSDRQHARRLRVDHKTVGTARRSLERLGKIPVVKTREAADGRRLPSASKPSTGESSPVRPADQHIDPRDEAVPAADGPGDDGEAASITAAPTASDEGTRSSDATAEDPAGESAAPRSGPARLRSMPTSDGDGPTAGDLVDWHPTAGQWSSYREFQVSEAAECFAKSMDRRLPRGSDEDIAGLCPPSMRKPSIFAARQAAAHWTALADALENPTTRLSAVEA